MTASSNRGVRPIHRVRRLDGRYLACRHRVPPPTAMSPRAERLSRHPQSACQGHQEDAIHIPARGLGDGGGIYAAVVGEFGEDAAYVGQWLIGRPSVALPKRRFNPEEAAPRRGRTHAIGVRWTAEHNNFDPAARLMRGRAEFYRDGTSSAAFGEERSCARGSSRSVPCVMIHRFVCRNLGSTPFFQMNALIVIIDDQGVDHLSVCCPSHWAPRANMRWDEKDVTSGRTMRSGSSARATAPSYVTSGLHSNCARRRSRALSCLAAKIQCGSSISLALCLRNAAIFAAFFSS